MYILDATKDSDGGAKIEVAFRYDAELVVASWARGSSQTVNMNIKDTIVKYLIDRHGVEGLEEFPVEGVAFFVCNNNNLAEKQIVGRDSTISSNGINHVVEVSGKLKAGEHLDDMLNCDALDAELKKVF